VDDPWGYGNSLEWATSCPPPRHNFRTLPRIRSERPAFDLHYPQAAGRIDYHATPEITLTPETTPRPETADPAESTAAESTAAGPDRPAPESGFRTPE
ncbi:cytochrome ubiquinol oxidase subunit I, partial [Frankia sp. B2]